MIFFFSPYIPRHSALIVFWKTRLLGNFQPLTLVARWWQKWQILGHDHCCSFLVGGTTPERSECSFPIHLYGIILTYCEGRDSSLFPQIDIIWVLLTFIELTNIYWWTTRMSNFGSESECRVQGVKIILDKLIRYW